MIAKVLELNTQEYPTKGFHTTCWGPEPAYCPKCKCRFRNYTPDEDLVTRKHMELCEGDSHKTLVKLDDWAKRIFTLR